MNIKELRIRTWVNASDAQQGVTPNPWHQAP